MNAIEVELTGTSPLLMGRCLIAYETIGRKLVTEHERAADKLETDRDGRLVLPRGHVLHAICREGRDRRPDLIWPRGWAAILTWPAIACDDDAAFSSDGGWRIHHGLDYLDQPRPQVFPRFDDWRAAFLLRIDEAERDPEMVRGLLSQAGEGRGLPQSSSFFGPGDWGRFTVSKWEPVAVVARAEAVGV